MLALDDPPNQLVTFPCAKCNRRIPTNQVRLLPDGKHICFDCAGFKPDTGPARRSSATAGEAQAAPSAHKIKYQCLKCKYEFYLKDGHSLKCPYCNGERIEEKQGGAQKLIDMHVNFRDNE